MGFRGPMGLGLWWSGSSLQQIRGFFRGSNNGKENGSYYMGYVGNNGKENGNFYGFRVP